MKLELTFSDAELAYVREAAAREGRTPTDQLHYWLRLGRVRANDQNFHLSRMDLALNGLLAPSELGALEQEEYLDKVASNLWGSDPYEDAYFAEMRARGMGGG